MRADFEEYLQSLPIKKATVSTYLSDLKRVETLYGDIDRLYDEGGLDELERSLRLDPSAPEPLPVTPRRDSIPVYATPVGYYRAFRSAGLQITSFDEPAGEIDAPDAPAYAQGIEGILREARYLLRSRNQALVEEVRRRDGCRCQACGYVRQVEGRYIIEVHHLTPLGTAKAAIVTGTEDLVCLCPNCHRSAHAKRSGPLSLDELRLLAER